MRVVALARVQGVVRSMLIVLLVSAALSGVARAADAPLNDDKQARSLYSRAEKSFDLGRFAEALTDYQAAYEAKPLPGFLFNIAQCYRNLSNFERARFFFRRYLALDPHAPNHRRVEELIAEMTKQLDAQAAAPATAPPPVEPRPADQPSTVASPTVLAPATPTLEPTPPRGASASAPILSANGAPAPPARPVWKRWWFWTGVGAVVAGGVVAALLLTRPETRTPGSLGPIDGR